MVLITKWYLAEQRALHEQRKYGVSSAKWAKIVAKIAQRYGCESILDYGSGQGGLAPGVRVYLPDMRIEEYDPAILGKDALPHPCDMVVCSDVLEHIEFECIDEVMEHISYLTSKVIFAVIALRPSEKKFLSDGRNAHVLLMPISWWIRKFNAHDFTIRDTLGKTGLINPGEFSFVAEKPGASSVGKSKIE